MKIQIVAQLLPHEIDEFERQLCVLSQTQIENDEIIVDVTLNINTVDWENTKLPKVFFVEKFNQLKMYLDNSLWCARYIFEVNEDGTCLGINDKRRRSARMYADQVDAFLWWDADIVFPVRALQSIILAAKSVKNKYYILTPQVTKLWDRSWDCMVNERYLDQPYGSEREINPYRVVNLNYGELSLKPNKTVKLGAGWLNLISSNLLTLTDIPDALGSYGLEDTYVMYCAWIMRKCKADIDQYLIQNLVVAENYKLRNTAYQSFITYKTNKEELRAVAEEQLDGAVDIFCRKMGYGAFRNRLFYPNDPSIIN
jgi:hypothetical protein